MKEVKVVACGWCSVAAMRPFWEGWLDVELAAGSYEQFALDTILVAQQRSP